jgi:hypothetical protein
MGCYLFDHQLGGALRLNIFAVISSYALHFDRYSISSLKKFVSLHFQGQYKIPISSLLALFYFLLILLFVALSKTYLNLLIFNFLIPNKIMSVFHIYIYILYIGIQFSSGFYYFFKCLMSTSCFSFCAFSPQLLLFLRVLYCRRGTE